MRSTCPEPDDVAGAVAPDPLSLPIGVARALHRHLAIALAAVRTTAPFDTLNAGSRSILQELLAGWARGQAPSQTELVRATGLSERFVRDALQQLEEALILRTARKTGKPAAYGAGLQLDRFLREFASGLDSKVWTRRTLITPAPGAGGSETTPAPDAGGSETTPAPDASGSRDTPAPDAGGSPATPARDAGAASTRYAARPVGLAPAGVPLSANLQRIHVVAPSAALPEAATATLVSSTTSPDSSALIKKKNLTSLSSPPERPATPTTATYLPDAVLWAAALRALVARYALGFPDRPAPRSFPIDDIETVVRVTADWTGSEADLDQEHLDAIAGATQKSKSQPPSVRFIWGSRDHFFRNAREVRRSREAARPTPPRPPKPSAYEAPAATLAELGAIARNGLALLDGLTGTDSARPKNSRFVTVSNPQDIHE